MEDVLINNIFEIAKDKNIEEKFCQLFIDYYEDMYKRGWIRGGCHCISSILHIILNEFGYYNILRLGVVEIRGVVFSHSWIEYNNMIFDIAVSETNDLEINISGVIFSDIDIKTLECGFVVYKDMIGKSPDKTGELFRDINVGQYFEECPEGRNVFWNYIIDFSKKYGKFINLSRLKEKYSNEKWTLIKNI